MKLSAHISLSELIPPETITLYGEGSVKFLDSRLVPLLEKIRELCGNNPMVLNTWHKGGSFRYRGYRPAECTVGASRSMHKSGKAADFDIIGMNPEAVRNIIRENADILMSMGLTRIETGIGWVHIDLKYTGQKTLKEFKP